MAALTVLGSIGVGAQRIYSLGLAGAAADCAMQPLDEGGLSDSRRRSGPKPRAELSYTGGEQNRQGVEHEPTRARGGRNRFTVDHEMVPRYKPTMRTINRVQTGVRIEERLLKVLKCLADFLDTARAYSNGLKALASKAGRPTAYHETITLAFLSLIAERLALRSFRDFDSFAAVNGELMDKSVLGRWYTPARLGADAPRRTF